MTAGRTQVAKTILVIRSLCLHVRWHGSETFTGQGRVFRKETDLLVVSQAARSMPRDIFWSASDFPIRAHVIIRVCAVSKLKMVVCLFYANRNAEVSSIDTASVRVILTCRYSPNHKAQPVFKGLG